MLLLPVRQSEHLVRRWPVITTAIILLNFIVHVCVVAWSPDVDARELGARQTEALSYYADHPYLHAPTGLASMFRSAGLVSRGPSEAPRGASEEREQAVLDSMWGSIEELREQLVTTRWGDRPADGRLATLITSQFLHASFPHLFFNMWFLWLVGCSVEDRWGRPLYAVFYLCAGAAAALAHRLAMPESDLPLVGASGAVAGVMGAFLVRNATARIEMWAWLFLPFRFKAPAFLLLPVWLGFELIAGMREGSISSVAHWAHVGGFVFGVVVAIAVAVSGIEATIDRSIEARQPARDLGARDLSAELDTLVAARLAGDGAAETRATIRVLGLYEVGTRDAEAADAFAAAQARGVAQTLPAQMRLRGARALARSGRAREAETAYAALHQESPTDDTSMMALIGHAQLLLGLQRHAEARALFEVARDSHLPHAHLDVIIAQGLRDAERGTGRATS